jgi:hypothetical protein
MAVGVIKDIANPRTSILPRGAAGGAEPFLNIYLLECLTLSEQFKAIYYMIRSLLISPTFKNH